MIEKVRVNNISQINKIVHAASSLNSDVGIHDANGQIADEGTALVETLEAVKPYFERVVGALPDVQALAACPEDDLLKLWEGLGYYNRVRNMQKAARTVVETYGGEFPADYGKLLALPGIGHYTAGAIGSIAFGIPMPAVDGNVLRVLSRFQASYEDILKQSVKNKFEQELQKVIPAERAGNFNQALIEIGAIVCVPNGRAKCGECPLAFGCRAKELGIVDELPRKKAKKDTSSVCSN